LIIVLLALGAMTTSAQGPATVTITSPAEGSTISDIVNVVGSVDFPDFQKYEIFLKIGDQLLWGATVYSPVDNGILARLDTKIFADGTYQLIVRQVHSNSQYDDFLGPMITLDNNLGAPRPHPDIQTSPLYPPFAGALARVQNCSGTDLEFDYVSPEGFCSHGDLWIMGKMQDQPVCTTVDVFLIPCEYRGTAWGTGEDRAYNYSFIAEHGKIYDIVFVGGGRLFINEVPGDDPNPGPIQASTQPTAGQALPVSGQAASAQQPAAAPQTTNQTLPVSGQAAPASGMPFVIVALGLISFLVIGGVIAMRRDKQIAE
jgi:hypothetical protein